MSTGENYNYKNMNRQGRKELANEIEERLDNDLDFDLSYEISDYRLDDGTSVVDVDIDIDDFDEDTPDDWDEQVEDLLCSVAQDWGGFISWDSFCISVSIPDDD